MKWEKKIFCGLTALFLLSVLYCCDLPAWNGFEFLIHNKALLTNVGYSIIASYVFYLIQIVIPNYMNLKRAGEKTKASFTKLYYELMEAKKLKEYFFEFDNDLITCHAGKTFFLKKIEENKEEKIKIFEKKEIFQEYERLIKTDVAKITENIWFQYLGDEQCCLIKGIEDMQLLCYLGNMLSMSNQVTKYEEIMEEITHFEKIIINLKKYIHIQNIPNLQIQCMDREGEVPKDYEKWKKFKEIGMSWIIIKEGKSMKASIRRTDSSKFRR